MASTSSTRFPKARGSGSAKVAGSAACRRGANPQSREVLIEALQTFGAIVVDRSRTPTLYARRNADYGADFGIDAVDTTVPEGDLDAADADRRPRDAAACSAASR